MLGSTVGELQERMSSREFAEWMAFAQVEPFGPEREDFRAALVAQTVANFSGRAKKALTIEDFMPKFDEVPEQDKSQSIKAKLAAFLGG